MNDTVLTDNEYAFYKGVGTGIVIGMFGTAIICFVSLAIFID